eukprot:gene18589-25101_t
MFARDYKRIDSVGMPATLPFSVYWEQGTSVADVWEEEDNFGQRPALEIPRSARETFDSKALDFEKTPGEIMKEQEALLMAKYGGMKPKKKPGFATKEHKFFDSADWALNKEQGKGGAAAGQPVLAPPVQLPPKLEPTPLPERRISHLDAMEK